MRLDVVLGRDQSLDRSPCAGARTTLMFAQEALPPWELASSLIKEPSLRTFNGVAVWNSIV